MNFTQNYKFAKFGLETEICSDFCEIWYSKQIEHATYEYNTRQYLERSRDYWSQDDYRLRIIIGCKIRLTVRTLLIALTPR